MSDTAYTNNLKERFRKTFGSLESNTVLVQYRAIVGTDDLPATPEGQLALTALKKLRDGDDPGPTPAEFAALEYMIRAMRPAPLVRHNAIDPEADPDFLAAFPDWQTFAAAFPQRSRAIGCLFKMEANQPPQGEGTGFLVAKDVVLTNAHVLDALTNSVRELEKGQATIQFGREVGVYDDDPTFDVLRVIAIHDSLDACLLSIATGADTTPLTLSSLAPSPGEDIAAVGYPFKDSRNPAFVAKTFNDVFGFKRVSPGTVTGLQSRTPIFFHDCSTLGGNSGSPLIRLRDNAVVGLHTGGSFMWKNTAVCIDALLEWVTQHLPQPRLSLNSSAPSL